MQRGLARERAALLLADVVDHFVERQAGSRGEKVRGAVDVGIDRVEPVQLIGDDLLHVQ